MGIYTLLLEQVDVDMTTLTSGYAGAVSYLEQKFAQQAVWKIAVGQSRLNMQLDCDKSFKDASDMALEVEDAGRVRIKVSFGSAVPKTARDGSLGRIALALGKNFGATDRFKIPGTKFSASVHLSGDGSSSITIR